MGWDVFDKDWNKKPAIKWQSNNETATLKRK